MEIRKMSQSELDKAIKEELERIGGYDAWRRKAMQMRAHERGGIGVAGASAAEQERAVSRCVQIGRRVSRHFGRGAIQAAGVL